MVQLPEDIRDRVTSYIKHQATKPRETILELVATSQQRYVDAVASVPDGIASKKPAPDEWSVRELTLHVIDAQASVAGVIERTARGETPSGRGGPGNLRADEGESFEALVSELRRLNETMLATIRALPAEPDLVVTAPHPFFGQLNCLEWAVFQRVHDEDHIQHAAKILEVVGGRG